MREKTKLKYNTLEEDNILCGLLVSAIIWLNLRNVAKLPKNVNLIGWFLPLREKDNMGKKSNDYYADRLTLKMLSPVADIDVVMK